MDFDLGLEELIIENRQDNTGSKIMTDQDALVLTPPPGYLLKSVELYYDNIDVAGSDSSRIWAKSQRSWSCSPLGNADPINADQYTLGLSKNIEVDTGWNKYTFEPLIEITSDSIFIWPDLIQQVRPRVSYAVGNNTGIGNLTGTACANPGMDYSVLDYMCTAIFVKTPDCLPFLLVTDADSACYAADTLHAITIIPQGANISYLSRDLVTLDTTFEVKASGLLTIDMSSCDQ